MDAELIPQARKLRDAFTADPHRPTYHFVTPEGICMPFDPNAAIFWKGRYHLMYIFQNELGHCFGHASSVDLMHWTHHPTALVPDDAAAGQTGDQGIFSGNAFVNKEGVPTIAYAGVETGVCLATADPSDDLLITWTKCDRNPVIAKPSDDWYGGEYQVGDPHMWVDGDIYRCATGAWSIPEGTGDTLYLFESTNMIEWEYAGRLYDRNPEWTHEKEDCSCADFYKLGDRHMLLCISHGEGCRYYLGSYADGRFTPEEHHRMNWPGGTCFAPESLKDDNGRRIFWAWALECRNGEAQQAAGWAGVMTMPRVLSLADDGQLRIEPPEEFEQLRLNPRWLNGVELADAAMPWEDVSGDCLELNVDIDPGDAQRVGLKLRCSPDGREQTVLTFLPAENKLVIDTTQSSLDPAVASMHPVIPMWEQKPVSVQEAPFELPAGQPLRLRIFMDRSIIEVFANRRQCVTQRIYPSLPDSKGISLFAEGGTARIITAQAWDMASANPW